MKCETVNDSTIVFFINLASHIEGFFALHDGWLRSEVPVLMNVVVAPKRGIYTVGLSPFRTVSLFPPLMNSDCKISDTWEVVLDCSVQCEATIDTSFQLLIRRVVYPSAGTGRSCSEVAGSLWNPKIGAITEKMSCPPTFSRPCEPNANEWRRYQLSRSISRNSGSEIWAPDYLVDFMPSSPGCPLMLGRSEELNFSWSGSTKDYSGHRSYVKLESARNELFSPFFSDANALLSLIMYSSAHLELGQSKQGLNKIHHNSFFNQKLLTKQHTTPPIVISYHPQVFRDYIFDLMSSDEHTISLKEQVMIPTKPFSHRFHVDGTSFDNYISADSSENLWDAHVPYDRVAYLPTQRELIISNLLGTHMSTSSIYYNTIRRTLITLESAAFPGFQLMTEFYAEGPRNNINLKAILASESTVKRGEEMARIITKRARLTLDRINVLSSISRTKLYERHIGTRQLTKSVSFDLNNIRLFPSSIFQMQSTYPTLKYIHFSGPKPELQSVINAFIDMPFKSNYISEIDAALLAFRNKPYGGGISITKRAGLIRFSPTSFGLINNNFELTSPDIQQVFGATSGHFARVFKDAVNNIDIPYDNLSILLNAFESNQTSAQLPLQDGLMTFSYNSILNYQMYLKEIPSHSFKLDAAPEELFSEDTLSANLDVKNTVHSVSKLQTIKRPFVNENKAEKLQNSAALSANAKESMRNVMTQEKGSLHLAFPQLKTDLKIWTDVNRERKAVTLDISKNSPGASRVSWALLTAHSASASTAEVLKGKFTHESLSVDLLRRLDMNNWEFNQKQSSILENILSNDHLENNFTRNATNNIHQYITASGGVVLVPKDNPESLVQDIEARIKSKNKAILDRSDSDKLDVIRESLLSSRIVEDMKLNVITDIKQKFQLLIGKKMNGDLPNVVKLFSVSADEESRFLGLPVSAPSRYSDGSSWNSRVILSLVRTVMYMYRSDYNMFFPLAVGTYLKKNNLEDNGTSGEYSSISKILFSSEPISKMMTHSKKIFSHFEFDSSPSDHASLSHANAWAANAPVRFFIQKELDRSKHSESDLSQKYTNLYSENWAINRKLVIESKKRFERLIETAANLQSRGMLNIQISTVLSDWSDCTNIIQVSTSLSEDTCLLTKAHPFAGQSVSIKTVNSYRFEALSREKLSLPMGSSTTRGKNAYSAVCVSRSTPFLVDPFSVFQRPSVDRQEQIFAVPRHGSELECDHDFRVSCELNYVQDHALEIRIPNSILTGNSISLQSWNFQSKFDLLSSNFDNTFNGNVDNSHPLAFKASTQHQAGSQSDFNIRKLYVVPKESSSLPKMIDIPPKSGQAWQPMADSIRSSLDIESSRLACSNILNQDISTTTYKPIDEKKLWNANQRILSYMRELINSGYTPPIAKKEGEQKSQDDLDVVLAFPLGIFLHNAHVYTATTKNPRAFASDTDFVEGEEISNVINKVRLDGSKESSSQSRWINSAEFLYKEESSFTNSLFFKALSKWKHSKRNNQHDDSYIKGTKLYLESISPLVPSHEITHIGVRLKTLSIGLSASRQIFPITIASSSSDDNHAWTIENPFVFGSSVHINKVALKEYTDSINSIAVVEDSVYHLRNAQVLNALDSMFNNLTPLLGEGNSIVPLLDLARNLNYIARLKSFNNDKLALLNKEKVNSAFEMKKNILSAALLSPSIATFHNNSNFYRCIPNQLRLLQMESQFHALIDSNIQIIGGVEFLASSVITTKVLFLRTYLQQVFDLLSVWDSGKNAMLLKGSQKAASTSKYKTYNQELNVNDVLIHEKSAPPIDDNHLDTLSSTEYRMDDEVRNKRDGNGSSQSDTWMSPEFISFLPHQTLGMLFGTTIQSLIDVYDYLDMQIFGETLFEAIHIEHMRKTTMNVGDISIEKHILALDPSKFSLFKDSGVFFNEVPTIWHIMARQYILEVYESTKDLVLASALLMQSQKSPYAFMLSVPVDDGHSPGAELDEISTENTPDKKSKLDDERYFPKDKNIFSSTEISSRIQRRCIPLTDQDRCPRVLAYLLKNYNFALTHFNMDGYLKSYFRTILRYSDETSSNECFSTPVEMPSTAMLPKLLPGPVHFPKISEDFKIYFPECLHLSVHELATSCLGGDPTRLILRFFELNNPPEKKFLNHVRMAQLILLGNSKELALTISKTEALLMPVAFPAWISVWQREIDVRGGDATLDLTERAEIKISLMLDYWYRFPIFFTSPKFQYSKNVFFVDKLLDITDFSRLPIQRTLTQVSMDSTSLPSIVYRNYFDVSRPVGLSALDYLPWENSFESADVPYLIKLNEKVDNIEKDLKPFSFHEIIQDLNQMKKDCVDKFRIGRNYVFTDPIILSMNINTVHGDRSKINRFDENTRFTGSRMPTVMPELNEINITPQIEAYTSVTRIQKQAFNSAWKLNQAQMPFAHPTQQIFSSANQQISLKMRLSIIEAAKTNQRNSPNAFNGFRNRLKAVGILTAGYYNGIWEDLKKYEEWLLTTIPLSRRSDIKSVFLYECTRALRFPYYNSAMTHKENIHILNPLEVDSMRTLIWSSPSVEIQKRRLNHSLSNSQFPSNPQDALESALMAPPGDLTLETHLLQKQMHVDDEILNRGLNFRSSYSKFNSKDSIPQNLVGEIHEDTNDSLVKHTATNKANKIVNGHSFLKRSATSEEIMDVDTQIEDKLMSPNIIGPSKAFNHQSDLGKDYDFSHSKKNTNLTLFQSPGFQHEQTLFLPCYLFSFYNENFGIKTQYNSVQQYTLRYQLEMNAVLSVYGGVDNMLHRDPTIHMHPFISIRKPWSIYHLKKNANSKKMALENFG